MWRNDMGGRILTGEVNCSDIKVTTGLEVEGITNHATVTEGTKDLDITINRKEYTIVGDDVYIPKLYDDAPQWLKDLVDVVVEVGVEANNADLLGQVQDLINQLANATVPLNTFTQSIIALNLEDARINTVVETLNSNFSDATSNINAQIIDVRNTFVSKDSAASTIATVLAAEISNGQLKNMATVGYVATALATETDARAADITALESSLFDAVGEEEIARATAISHLNTYVGITESGNTTGTGALASISILQKQNDGVIETVTGTYDVIINPQDPNLAELVLTAEPYASWKAQDVSGIDTRLAHIGDVYIKYGITSNGAREYVASFKFIRTIVDASDAHKSTDADGFTWALIVDQAAQDAYNQALNAYDLADGKASIFTTSAQPSSYKINDMMIVTTANFSNGTTTFSNGVVLTSNAIRVSGFVAADWVKKINDTEDLDAFVSVTYTPTVTSLQNQVDGKIESWYTASTNDPKSAWTDAPTRSKHDGDMWYQTDTKLSYYYSSSTNSWNLIDDAKAIQALTNAAAAQTSANNAQTSANTANSLLADIASDNKLVPSEKVAVKKEWDIIQSEYTKNLAQGNVYGVSTSSYTSVYNSLSGYITPLLSSLTTTSDIVGTTFRSMFKAYYDANVDLLNAVANKINAIADGKITSYYIDTFSSLQALSNGWTTAEKTSNVGDLATVWNDSTLDNNGTWRWNGTSWVTTRDKKLVALASDVTTLSTELDNGTNTWASADSTLENSLKTEISDEGARVESKFAYNSIVSIDGIYKKSGFGLTTNYTSGSGTEANPYVSEFWIDASRLKFTNSNQTGRTSPFTIDASGTTPQVKFNGVVEFSNVSNVPSLGSNNMLVNAGPTLGNETYGWQIGFYNTNIAPTGPSAGFDIWRPTGGGSVYAVVGGSPTVGTLFDLKQSTNIPVVAGKRYEISALLSSHRCTSVCVLAFFNSSGTYISESGAGTANSTVYNGAVGNWVRQGGFVTAPAGTAYAQFYVRSTVTGTDPYCFVAKAYMAEASASSTQFSTWGEGLSANSTTIDGGKITTGTVSTDRLNVNAIMAKDMTFTGKITGGSGGLGGIIQSYNGNMKIDLVNGSIYIA